MSKFSTRLQIVLERLNLSQSEVAKRAGMQPSLLNGYYKGIHRPAPDVLEKLCSVFDQQERAEIIIAHLQDEIPPSAQDLIRVVNLIKSPRIEETSDQITLDLPRKVRRDVEFLLKSMDQPSVSDWIQATVKVLRGD
jgi:transcriptional regulator with XRE-family HTH domain